MAKEEIIIRVHPNGDRQVETNGFIGSACAKASADVLKRLGGKGEMKKKPVYHQTAKEKETQKEW